MSKINLALCLGIATTLSSNSFAANLPVVNNSDAEKTMVTVPLNTLEKNKFYKITCDIKNSQEGASLLFAPRLLSNGTYGNVKANEAAMPNNSVKLKEGQNKLSFLVRSKQDDTEKYNQFTLNGGAQSFEVGQCQAEEQSEKDIKNSKLMSGSFRVYNYTGYEIGFSVGNFFPTGYSLYPYGSTYVSVSTDNQNIHIDYIY